LEYKDPYQHEYEKQDAELQALFSDYLADRKMAKKKIKKWLKTMPRW
jgi:hypothetical protein